MLAWDRRRGSVVDLSDTANSKSGCHLGVKGLFQLCNVVFRGEEQDVVAFQAKPDSVRAHRQIFSRKGPHFTHMFEASTVFESGVANLR